MTLLEICRLVRRYWYLVIGAPVVCMIIAGVYGYIASDPRYEATSSVIASDASGTMNVSNIVSTIIPIAEVEAEGVGCENAKVEKKPAQKVGDIDSLTITVTASDPSSAVEGANQIAELTAEAARAYYLDLRDQYEEDRIGDNDLLQLRNLDGAWDFRLMQDVLSSDTLFNYCSFRADKADGAKRVGAASPKAIAVVGAGVLFVVLCILVLYGYCRRPLCGLRDVEKLSRLPILNYAMGSSSYELFWANVRLSSTDWSQGSLCLAPLSAGSLLESEVPAPLDDDCMPTIAVTFCPPLSESPKALYQSREASGVVICFRLWSDTANDLEDMLSEMRRINAKVIGLMALPFHGFRS